MEEHKKLDEFLRKSIKEAGLENPSLDFTTAVLSKIQAEKQKSTVFEYQPILSKKVWVLIAAAVTLVFATVIFGNFEMESTWFSISQLNRLTAFNLSGRFPELLISNTFIYGFLIFAFFVVVQVSMLKQRFDKRYNLN